MTPPTAEEIAALRAAFNAMRDEADRPDCPTIDGTGDYFSAATEKGRAWLVLAGENFASLLAAAEERQRLAERLREAEFFIRPIASRSCAARFTVNTVGLCGCAPCDARRFLAGGEEGSKP